MQFSASRGALWCGCLLAGILASNALQDAMKAPDTPEIKSAPLRFKVVYRKPVVAEEVASASKEILPLKVSDTSTLKSTKSQELLSEPIVVAPVEPPKKAVNEGLTSATATPVVETSELVENTSEEEDALSALPLIAAKKAPPVPGGLPDTPIFTLAQVEVPGQSILVLGLLVDDRGIIVDTVIAVPSRNALEDLTFAISYQGSRWSQIDPPLMVGEKRWLEIRIDYDEIIQKANGLP